MNAPSELHKIQALREELRALSEELSANRLALQRTLAETGLLIQCGRRAVTSTVANTVLAGERAAKRRHMELSVLATPASALLPAQPPTAPALALAPNTEASSQVAVG